jgi:hypothetical protein
MATILVRRYGLYGHFVVKQSQQISWPRCVINGAATATLETERQPLVYNIVARVSLL